MKAQTLRFVPLSEVLSRLPAEVDLYFLMEFFNDWVDLDSDGHTLVPWDVVRDELADCFAELGYRPFSDRHVFPIQVFSTHPHTFVDLEN